MKKYLLSFAVLLSALLFTACNDKDNGKNIYSVPVTKGAYVICSGNAWGGIQGSLTYIDYTTGTAAPNQFAAKNGRSLGSTPNNAIVYGDKMYIAVTDDNTIEVVDAKTLASIKQIKLTQLVDNVIGVSPRCITAADGIIYVSTYGASNYDWETYTTSGNGYVAAIDTLTFSLKDTYTVGSYPEGLAVSGNYLVVANSDYSAVTKASLSVINLSTKAVETVTNAMITNPTAVAIAGADIYVLDMGNYYDVAGGIRKVTSADNVTTLFDCTNATFVGTKIFASNCVYGQNTDGFIVYDISTGSKNTYDAGVDRFFYPNVVTADPITGNIFVASYSENEDTPNYPSYTTNGYVVEYNANGTKLKEYGCGVGPNAIVFNMGYEEIEY